MNGIRTSLGPITTKAKMINKPPCNSGVKFLNIFFINQKDYCKYFLVSAFALFP